MSEKEFVEFLQLKERDVENREKEVRKKTKRLVYASILIPLVVVLFGHHWILCIASPTFLEPEEGDTRVLTLHKRHWFSEDSVKRVEVRHSDLGSDEWMIKSENGEWVQAFEWRDQVINQ